MGLYSPPPHPSLHMHYKTHYIPNRDQQKVVPLLQYQQQQQPQRQEKTNKIKTNRNNADILLYSHKSPGPFFQHGLRSSNTRSSHSYTPAASDPLILLLRSIAVGTSLKLPTA